MSEDGGAWTRALCDLDGTIRAAILAGRPIDAELADRVEALTFTDCADLVDLGFVATLPRLRSLDLTGTGVRNLTPLVDAPHLERLILMRTTVADLSPLARLPRLAEVNLDRTPITDLSPLAGSPSLRRLDLGSASIGDLAALGVLPKLAILDIGIAPTPIRLDLSRFPALETLVGVAVEDATLWPDTFPASLRELVIGGAAWPEGRPLPDLPRLVTPDWRLIDDGGPCSETFEFWRLCCDVDDAGEASGSAVAGGDGNAVDHHGD